MLLAAVPAWAAGPMDELRICLPPLDDAGGLVPTVRLAPIFRPDPRAGPLGGLAAYIGPFLARNVPGEPASAASATPEMRLANLNFDGVAELLAGRRDIARTRFESCIAQAAKQGDREAGAACASNLGAVFAAQGDYAAARRHFEQAQERFHAFAAQTGDSSPYAPFTLHRALIGQQRAALNLGHVALALGQLEVAQKHWQFALDGLADALPPDCGSAPARDLALLQRRLGQNAAADALQRRIVPRTGQGKQKAGNETVVEAGLVALGGAAQPARVAAAPRADDKTTAFPTETGAVGSEAGLREAMAQAAKLEREGQGPAAIDAWLRSALRAAAAGRREDEASAHTALMRLHAAAGRPAVAILHGKRAVNALQALRAGASGLSRAERRSYLRERQQLHTQLVQLLLDERRLAEAERVLQLLKEDEGRQFAADTAPAARATLPETPAEAAAHRRFDSAAAELRRLEAERSALAADRTFTILLLYSREQMEQARLKAVDDILALLGARGPRADEPVRRQLAGLPAPMLAAARALVDGNGDRLKTALAHLADDAPRFAAVPVDDARRADIAESRRRADEFRRAVLPVLDGTAPAPDPVQVTVKPAPAPEPAATNPRDRLAQLAQRLLGGRSRETPAPAPKPAADSTMPGVFAMEPLERLWRIDEARSAAEARFVQAEAAPVLAAGSVPDDGLAALARATPATALLYLLPGETRTDALLVGARGRQAWRIDIARAELDARIARFRAVLRDPGSDPRPAARELHDLLLGPLAPALADSGAKVVVLSLGGRLRFVPFGALHDGERWFVERYALALNPGARASFAPRAAATRWRVAAFGAPAGGEGLPPLPGVPAELSGVAQGPGSRVWLDRAFTAPALRGALGGGHEVVHIASHFRFEPGDAARSYLLLGDGSRLSLQDLAGPGYGFERTELVTLSACQTGLSDDDAFGQEVDGLGALLLARGAPSVLASMWQVQDDSTARLMTTLYRLRQPEGAAPLPLALALQQAQRTMIGGSADAAPAGGTRGAALVSAGAASALGGAHPYHWAAFVLMGHAW